MTRSRRVFGVGLALMGGALLGGATPLAGQIGALAAAAAAAGAGGEYALAGAPVFAESGLILADGWAAGAFGVTTSTSYEALNDFFEPIDADFTVSNLALSAFFAAGEKLMVGAVLNPYVSGEVSGGGYSNSVSGLGNLTVFGKLALTQSGPTRVAGTVSVQLPTGDEAVVTQTTNVAVGLGVSRRLNATTSLHGGASVGFTSDDSSVEGDSGSTGFGFNGAVVKQLNSKAWISGELLGSASDGAWQVLLAPAARFQAGPRVFIDLGLAFGALSSDDVTPIDYGLAVGLTLIPGR